MKFNSLILIAICMVIVTFMALSGALVFAQSQGEGEGKLDPAQPVGITAAEITQRFAAQEKKFKQAREQYVYRQDISVEVLDGDTPTGQQFRLVEDVLFDEKGKRLEQVAFAPQSTLESILLTREDMDDIQHRLPFVLTSDEIPEYSILYEGQQQEDELHTYVFDIAPKQMEKNKRYFQGRIWVDDHDFQIVKTEGITVPQIHKKNNENLFPKFTTWRQQVDGQYWFPTYTYADDILHFHNGAGDVHIREKIRYKDYKRFGSSVKITYQGQDVEKGQSQQPAEQK